MPDRRKRTKKEASRKAEGRKQLRQTTLPGSAARRSLTQSPGVISPKKQVTPRGKRKKHVYESSESSDCGAIQLEQATAAKKSDDESSPSPSPIFSPAKKRHILMVASDSDRDEDHSSGFDQVAPRHRRLRQRVSAVRDSAENSVSPPPGQFAAKSKAKQLDSGEDLSDEVDKRRIIGTRLRSRDKKTVFQRNLEKLKRKKMGKPMSSSESSEAEEEESDQGHASPFKGAKPAGSRAGSLFSGDDDDSDSSSGFIVEDDGQADVVQLPTEFSMRSHDDLAHQFKIIFQFLVHTAVRPTVDRPGFMEDQMKAQDYFAFPLRVVRRKLSGLRDSLVASSVWRPKFKKALEDYPTLERVPLDFAVPSCDACHLGGRLSTVLGRLGGTPYDILGFADHITRDSEEDSGDNSEASVTRLKKSRFGFFEFHLGRFCARRVHVYHQLSHWEYHLFGAIRSELDDLQAAQSTRRGFVRVAYAQGKQPPNDLSDADSLCDWLDERGIIDREWHKVESMMENAHNLELSAKKGEED